MAQAAKPKDAAAEAAAAMERARKQAANPMRIILEASKAKKRPGEDAAPPAPAAEASVRPVVNRTVPSAVAAEPVVARAVAVPASASAPAPASPPPAPAPAPAPVVAQVTLNSDLEQSKAAESVPSLVPTGGVSVAAPSLGAMPVAAPTLEVAQAKPRLISMVEPEVPQRLLDELGRNAIVAVDMTIKADGSVGDVAVASPAPRALLRVLTSALEQWRFAPSPAPRQHRVELVFNSDR